MRQWRQPSERRVGAPSTIACCPCSWGYLEVQVRGQERETLPDSVLMIARRKEDEGIGRQQAAQVGGAEPRQRANLPTRRPGSQHGGVIRGPVCLVREVLGKLCLHHARSRLGQAP